MEDPSYVSLFPALGSKYWFSIRNQVLGIVDCVLFFIIKIVVIIFVIIRLEKNFSKGYCFELRL